MSVSLKDAFAFMDMYYTPKLFGCQEPFSIFFNNFFMRHFLSLDKVKAILYNIGNEQWRSFPRRDILRGSERLFYTIFHAICDI